MYDPLPAFQSARTADVDQRSQPNFELCPNWIPASAEGCFAAPRFSSKECSVCVCVCAFLLISAL